MSADLIGAIQARELQKVQDAIRSGAEIEARDDGGYTPLILAALYGLDDIVEFLIASGANVNAATKWGATALSEAAKGGEHRVVELLLANGADVNHAEYDGYTPLMRAVRFEQAVTAVHLGNCPLQRALRLVHVMHHRAGEVRQIGVAGHLHALGIDED